MALVNQSVSAQRSYPSQWAVRPSVFLSLCWWQASVCPPSWVIQCSSASNTPLFEQPPEACSSGVPGPTSPSSMDLSQGVDILLSQRLIDGCCQETHLMFIPLTGRLQIFFECPLYTRHFTGTDMQAQSVI